MQPQPPLNKVIQKVIPKRVSIPNPNLIQSYRQHI